MQVPDIRKEEYAEIGRLVRSTAGIALGDTRQALVVARLSRRLRALGMSTFAEYTDFLRRGDPDGREMHEMINCITTNKTEFFREEHHFEWLRAELIPALRQRAKATGARKIRIWSAGCSTGQEPYTIAMVLAEALTEGGWDARILASDIDTQVLSVGQAGEYDEAALEGVPDALRRKYFDRRGSVMRVNQRLRDLVAFRRVNFIEPNWPISALFDVIFCRNVTIYFDRETQARVYARFAKQMVPEGYLVAGHSENLHWLKDSFEPIGRTIYRRLGRAASAPAPRASHTRISVAPAALAAANSGVSAGDVAIQSGELHASATGAVVRTTLGSCVAACLFDPIAGVGGMNHFMLPDGDVQDGTPMRFGKHAMDALLLELVKLGATRAQLRAKVFGGAHVLPNADRASSIPGDNVAFVRESLARMGIPIVAEKVGGDSPLMVRFETKTGRAFVRSVEETETPARRLA